MNDLTSEIIGCGINVHKELGPGLLESAYRFCLRLELVAHGFRVDSEMKVPLVYRGVTHDMAYRLDLMVNDLVIIEVKSVSSLPSICGAQMLTYLRLMRAPVGLVMNFNRRVLKDGIHRILNPDVLRRPT